MKSSSFSTFHGWELGNIVRSRGRNHNIGRQSKSTNRPPLLKQSEELKKVMQQSMSCLLTDWQAGTGWIWTEWGDRVIERHWLSEDINTQTGCVWMWLVGMLGRQKGGHTVTRRGRLIQSESYSVQWYFHGWSAYNMAVAGEFKLWTFIKQFQYIARAQTTLKVLFLADIVTSFVLLRVCGLYFLSERIELLFSSTVDNICWTPLKIPEAFIVQIKMYILWSWEK